MPQQCRSRVNALGCHPFWEKKQPKPNKKPPQPKQNHPQNSKQLLSECVSGLRPLLVFGCMPERLGFPCPGCAPLGLPPCPWHLPAGAAACPGPHNAEGVMPHGSRYNCSTCLWGCGQQAPASAPGNLAAPASSAGKGSPASGCLPMGCAYRRAFPADFWLCSDPLRADKPPGLAVRLEGLLSV